MLLQRFCLCYWLTVLRFLLLPPPVWSLTAHGASTAIRYICGRRCKYTSCSNSNSNSSNALDPVPLVVIGGMSQSIESWEHHLSALSKNRDVLVYECLGQGPLPPHVSSSGTEEEYFRDVSLQVHADDFASIVSSALSHVGIQRTPVDVCGFSFGGRVALAAASIYPHFIRKLHITGVPARRDANGRDIFTSWKNLLIYNDDSSLYEYAYASINASHSEEFIGKNHGKIQKWVDFIQKSNTRIGLMALLEQTHTDDEQNMWHPVCMAQRIASHGCIAGRLTVGRQDKLASHENVEILSNLLGWGPIGIYDGVGHAVPIEKPRQWREDLLSFLDANDMQQ